MFKNFISFLLLSVSVIGNTQELSINTLENLLNKKDWKEVRRSFSGTKWTFDKNMKGKSVSEEIYNFGYDKSMYSSKAKAWLSLYTFDDTPEMIGFNFFEKNLYNSFKSNLGNSSYVKYDTENNGGIKADFFKNSNFFLRLVIDKTETDSEGHVETQYYLVLQKRGGYYDFDNGFKKVYFDDGKLKQSYHLSNGEFHGQRKIYHPNGKLKSSTYYHNGVKHGLFTEFYYQDNSSPSSQLVIKETGEYINGEKNGIWKITYLGENRERVLNYTTYVNGLKNGPFQKPEGDSLIVGKYKNDVLHGAHKIYLDIERWFYGGVINTDTTKLDLITKGFYSDGKKDGIWWIDNFSEISTGRYFNDKKTGEWEYKFPELKDSLDQEKPASNQIFLTVNYKNGKRNGLSSRYWYTYKDKYPCPEDNANLNKTDGCYTTIYMKVKESSFYTNDKLDGLYELKDKNNVIISKGYYVNGVKDGGWLEVSFNEVIDNSTKESQGFYNRGVKEGEWKEKETYIYNSNNIIDTLICISKGKYLNDKKNGEWKRYN